MNRLFLASLLVLAGCAPQKMAQPSGSPVTTTPVAQVTPAHNAATTPNSNEPRQLTWSIAGAFPHDTSAFTEGLLWRDGYFYESTGLEGKSSIRKVDPASGQVLQRFNMPSALFGEGLAFLDGQFYNLTWQSKVGFIFDPDFKPKARFSYSDEGWGLTTDGKKLLQSDGTDTLTWRSPQTFAAAGQVKVTREGVAVDNLNELEWIHGYVWANVWQTNTIVIIEPKSGDVVAQLDLTGLLKPEDRTGQEDVLNGIAYDAKSDRVFVTGKNWPKLFWLQVESAPGFPQ